MSRTKRIDYPICDLTFGLNDQALQVGKLLSKVDFTKINGYYDVETPRVKTSTYYNGRERGIALTLSGRERPTFAIIVSEGRNTNQIVIDNFPIKQPNINSVTLDDFSDYAYYVRRKFVECKDYDRAVEVILELIEGWFAGKENLTQWT